MSAMQREVSCWDRKKCAASVDSDFAMATEEPL